MITLKKWIPNYPPGAASPILSCYLANERPVCLHELIILVDSCEPQPHLPPQRLRDTDFHEMVQCAWPRTGPAVTNVFIRLDGYTGKSFDLVDITHTNTLIVTIHQFKAFRHDHTIKYILRSGFRKKQEFKYEKKITLMLSTSKYSPLYLCFCARAFPNPRNTSQTQSL